MSSDTKMNNSCLAGYKNVQEKFMKLRNNKTSSGSSKFQQMEKLANSDRYKKFRSELKTKCPMQYKKSQQVFLKQAKGIERLRKMKMFAKNPKLQASFSYMLKVIEKLKK
jgi:hypothetical protein